MINGIIVNVSGTITNNLGNKNITTNKQYNEKKYRLLPPNKYDVSDRDTGIVLYLNQIIRLYIIVAIIKIEVFLDIQL